MAGTKLVLHFPNAGAAETFRTRLHHQKAGQEKTFIGLGLSNAEEKTVLQFKVKKADDGDEVVAYVAFVLPSPLKKYPVVIIEEQDVNKDNDAQVRTVVG